jgi:hypothetical protein
VRQFRGIGQSCINVVEAKGGIARQDLILGGTLGKTVQYHGDGYSGPCCTDLTAANLWVTAQELLPRRHMPSLRGCRPDVQSMIAADAMTVDDNASPYLLTRYAAPSTKSTSSMNPITAISIGACDFPTLVIAE